MSASEPESAAEADVESYLDDYERLWQRGIVPNIVEFLRERGWPEGSAPVELVEEIGSIDLYQRWRRRTPLDGLLPAFPCAGDYARLLLDKDALPMAGWSAAEQEAKATVGTPQSSSLKGSAPRGESDLQQLSASISHVPTLVRSGDKSMQKSGGLRVRCPNCSNPIELVPDAELESIACESCGSDFSLVNDGVATRVAPTLTMVGHFELIERVGMGAFGAVWKARDTRLERTVAIKIPGKGQFDPDQERAFIREARNVAQLSHAGIVPVHEVGRDGDTLYIISEFIHGVTLADWITTGPASARESAEVCRGVAEALHHAHLRGVVHRDLKPGNVMLNEAHEPLLMDFGLAKRHSEEVTMTLEGHVLGTPAYMSPEQARGDSSNADARSDIYSLGVMLFQLLTGELPFRGNARMLIHQVLHADPPSPRKLNPSTPRDLDTITLKCLSKSPNARYASAAQVAAELSRWLDGKPIKARPIGPFARLARWSARNPTIAGLALSVVASLVAAATVSGVFAIRAAEREVDARDARNAVEKVAYRANIERAQQALKENNPLRARNLLLEVAGWDTTRNYERFEWRHLMTVVRRLAPIELLGHEGVVSSLAYSNDGKTLFSSGRDGTIQQWDLTAPDRSTILYKNASKFFQPNLKGLAVSERQGERTLAYTQYGSSGGPVARLLVEGDQEFLNDREHVSDPAKAVAFSSDGKWLLTASASEGSDYEEGAGFLRRWNVRRRQVRDRATIPWRPAAIATLYDGKVAVAGSAPPTEPQFWRSEIIGHLAVFADDLSKLVFNVQIPSVHLRALVASPREDLVAVGDWEKTILVRFDSESGATTTEEIPHCGTALSFSADGALLAGCGIDGTAWTYDTSMRRISQQLSVNDTGASSIALSPNSEAVAIGDDVSIKIFPTRLPSVERLLVAGEGAKLRGLAFSQDEELLAAAFSDGVWVWDLSKDQPLPGCPLPYTHAASIGFAPDSHRLFIGDGGKLVSLDLDSRSERVHKIFRESSIYAIDLVAVGDAKSADDLRILVGIRTKGYMPWRSGVNFGECSAVLLEGESMRETARVEGLHGHLDNVKLSPDGTLFATPMVNTSVQVFSAESGKSVQKLPSNSSWIRGIDFFAGRNALVSSGWDTGVKIWDLDTGESSFLDGHKRFCFDLGISENDRSVASLGELGRLVIWDTSTGDAVEFEPSTQGFSYSLAFSPQGRYLATESANRIQIREADADIASFARAAEAAQRARVIRDMSVETE